MSSRPSSPGIENFRFISVPVPGMVEKMEKFLKAYAGLEQPFIALVDENPVHSMALQNNFALLNCRTVWFASKEDFLLCIKRGEWFDAVVIVGPDEISLDDFLAIREFSDIATLAVLDDFQLKKLINNAGRGFFRLHKIDLVCFMLNPSELALRLLSVISAASQIGSPLEQVFGEYRFKMGMGIVEHDHLSVQLDSSEFDLALELFRNAGRILPRERLVKFMRGTHLSARNRSLDVVLGCLRKKLCLHKESGVYLNSIFGQGYILQVARK